jgi:lysophospholipase L1-like esterase
VAGPACLLAAFGTPADPTLQANDGLHPSLAGQVAITRSLVERLTQPTR